MSLDSITSSQYLAEIALHTKICRETSTNPHQHLQKLEQFTVQALADSARKEILGIMTLDTNLVIQIITGMSDEKTRSKTAERLYRKTEDPELKKQLAYVFDFAAARARTQKNQEADSATLSQLQATTDVTHRTELLQNIRAPKARQEGIKIVNDQSLNSDFEPLRAKVEETKRALLQIHTLVPKEIKKLLAEVKLQIRDLAFHNQPEECVALAHAARAQVDAARIDQGLEQAASIFAKRANPAAARLLLSEITITSRQKKVVDLL